MSKTAISHYPLYKGFDMFTGRKNNGRGNISFAQLSVDEDFISLLGISWKISPLNGIASLKPGSIIVNERAVAQLELPAGNPVGSYIDNGTTNLELAGVVKDFNFSSLEYQIKPLVLSIVKANTFKFTEQGGCVFIKVKAGTTLQPLLKAVEDIYTRYANGAAFNYAFMDDAFNDQYKAEDRLAWIFGIFSRITLLLAILGLLGLSSFSIERRRKEIGVRKVLGASTGGIVYLLSRNFLQYVLLSIFIGSAIAWMIMHAWLEGFAYRVAIEWWMFALPALLVLGVTFATISYHTIRAALENPVNSIRSQ